MCYFAIFIDDPVPSDSKEMCTVSLTAVTAIADTSVERVICFPPNKTHLDVGTIMQKCNFFIVCIFQQSEYAYE